VYLAEFPREQRRDQAALAEIHDPNDNRGGFFGRHRRERMKDEKSPTAAPAGGAGKKR
jgi:hypothetical protein